MDTLVVVVGNGVCDANVQFVNIPVSGQWAKLFFDRLNAALHEAILPGRAGTAR